MRDNDCYKILKSLKERIQEKGKHTSRTSCDLYMPTDRTCCSCTDSNGESKYLYTSKKELEYILATQSVNLQAYPCPHEKGWHVTKG